jgi:hypothetical protein
VALKLRYAATLGAGAVQLLLLAAAVGNAPSISLAHPLLFYVITLWSRAEPSCIVQLLASGTVRATFVPWCLLAVCTPLTGLVCALHNVLGIAAALAFDAVVGMPPPALIQANGQLASPVARRPSPPKSGAKALAKVAPAGREQWVQWAQIALAVALVAFHGGSLAVERRADHSADLRMARRIRSAVDVSGPQISRLVDKFAQSRRAASADAETIFAAWAFAVEHWQQSILQRSSQTNVNNLSAADPELTRQTLTQALGRSELPQGLSDAETVAEVYSLMGLNRLLVTPESQPFFLSAVDAVRQHRARTLAAWGRIKEFVRHGDLADVKALPGTGESGELEVRPCKTAHALRHDARSAALATPPATATHTHTTPFACASRQWLAR